MVGLDAGGMWPKEIEEPRLWHLGLIASLWGDITEPGKAGLNTASQESWWYENQENSLWEILHLRCLVDTQVDIISGSQWAKKWRDEMQAKGCK